MVVTTKIMIKTLLVRPGPGEMQLECWFTSILPGNMACDQPFHLRQIIAPRRVLHYSPLVQSFDLVIMSTMI